MNPIPHESPAMSRPLIPFVLAAAAAALPAQMSGTFLIDPTGGPFPTFQSAVNAAFVNGVSGPVLFLVSPGTYVASTLVPPIPGASATNTITFQSLLGPGTVILQGGAGDTIALLGVAFQRNGWLVFDGLDFDLAPGHAISGTQNVEGIEIRNCRFGSEHRAVAAGEFRHAIIVSENSGTEVGWRVHHNRFVFPGRTFRTAYGIYLSNGGGWDIRDNEFDLNGCDYGLYMINQNRRLDTVWNNLFFGSLVSSTSSSANATCAIRADISNYENDFAHNTFNVTVPGTAGCCIASSGLSGTSPALNRMHGNVFAMIGAGVCIVSGATSPFVSDGNLFWAPSGEIGRLGASTPGFTTLAAWQTASGQDASSLQADPLFRNGTIAPYDLRPLPGSPAINAAVGTPAYVDHDKDGRLRDATPDIGAYESSCFALYGQGCPGTGGLVPALASSGTFGLGSPNFSVDLSNAPASAPVAVFGGTSRVRTLAGIPLPYALGGGCSVLASPDAIRFMFASGTGTASQLLPIPNNPALAGANLYFQWIVGDPGSGSPTGLTVSQAGAAQL